MKKKQIKKIEKMSEKEKKLLEDAAYILSRKYKYLKLMSAAKKETAEIGGREVHGYMERMFGKEVYDWLMEYDVLDLACHLALKDYQPEIYSLIEDYDFPSMERSLVILPNNYSFGHYPEFEFNRIIIYSDEPLKKDLYWKSNYEWETEDGYDTTVSYAPCNLLNMGSPLHDLPVAVVKDAIGKSKLYFKAKTSSEALTKERDDILKERFFKMRQKEKMKNDKIDELKIESRVARKKYADLKHKLLSRDTSTDEESFKSWEKRYNKSQALENVDIKNVVKNIAYVIITVFFLILAIYIFTLLFTPPSTPSELPETAGVLILNIFKRGC